MQLLNNKETLGVIRGKINANFLELDENKISSTSVLTKTNTTAFIPTGNYHPATKLYVDNLGTSIKSTYDPQNINSDAFDRTNHTGTQLPSTIVQDSDNRFVSDSQIASWNAKEPAIGTKGTAFNKSFGTIAGTVAEGNHSHTKSDIGLDNVDNTSDVNKPVSTAQQTAIDAKLNKVGADILNFTARTTEPTYRQGDLYYESEHKSLVLITDIPGVKHNIGQEPLLRVINVSGAQIDNLQVVKSVGADVTSGFPSIQLAQANNFDNSTVLGIATHNIANNTQGFVTTGGVIHNVNTSAFSQNDILYLDPDSAGGVTNVKPDIITIVGTVLIADASNGTILVNIVNNLSLPIVFAKMDVSSKAISLTTSWQTITGYDNKIEIVSSADLTNGIIHCDYSGLYRVSGSCTISFTSAALNRTIYSRLYDITASAAVKNVTIPVGKDVDEVSASVCPAVQLIEGHDYAIQFSADTAFSATIDVLDFDIESIRIPI